MIIRFAHLCDYASISTEGKLSVMGIFSRINGSSLPLTHPQAFLAWELELSATELDQPFQFEVRCMGPDGKEVFRTVGQGKISLKDGARPKPGARPRSPQLMVINGLEFTEAGDHLISLWVNGDLKWEVPFDVHISAGPEPRTPA